MPDSADDANEDDSYYRELRVARIGQICTMYSLRYQMACNRYPIVEL